MFALTVRSLDGSAQRVEVGPGATVASLRAEIGQAQALSAFHDVRLFYGAQELIDEAPVVIEVQSVKTVSLGKIMEYLTVINKDTRTRSIRDSVKQQCFAAIALLSEQTDLPHGYCQKLLALLAHGFGPHPDIRWALADAFGQTCGDPMPYIQTLFKMLCEFSRWRALFTIVKRLGEASLRSYAEEIVDLSLRIAHFTYDGIKFPFLVDACFLLGEYAEAAHKKVLQKYMTSNHSTIVELVTATLEKIDVRLEARAKGAAQEARRNLDVHCDSGHAPARASAFSPTRRDVGRAVAMETQVNEQEVKMMLALQMDEAEVLAREGADVAEAILRSKSDAQGSECLPDAGCSNLDTRIDGDGSGLKYVQSMASSSNDSPPLSSRPSAPSLGVTEVLPSRASLHAVAPHLVDGRVPSIGTVDHNNGCTICRRKARGKECKYGTACMHCHGPHDVAEVSRPGGSSRQRSAKRIQYQSVTYPPTPNSFD